MSNVAPRIFLSYCHADASKVRKIKEDLGCSSIELIRDERALGYTEDIESYMKKIRTTDYALVIVSDVFLYSTNCIACLKFMGS
ncbi:TIR domain-containing protein [Nitrosococcus watsonii]|uniref:TIR domain-containing protein n=1 Tax=Nitrosococcus watsonii TaxID=473531 RepID=UPI0012F746FE